MHWSVGEHCMIGNVCVSVILLCAKFISMGALPELKQKWIGFLTGQK